MAHYREVPEVQGFQQATAPTGSMYLKCYLSLPALIPGSWGASS